MSGREAPWVTAPATITIAAEAESRRSKRASEGNRLRANMPTPTGKIVSMLRRSAVSRTGISTVVTPPGEKVISAYCTHRGRVKSVAMVAVAVRVMESAVFPPAK